MKNLTNIATGILREFGNFYKNVEFSKQGANEVFEMINSEIPEDIKDIKDSPEFWCAEFVDPFDNKTYVIAADGEATSSGKYVVAEIIEE